MYDVTVIGAAIIDILAFPAGPHVFETGSEPMDTIRMSFGGDALNEAVTLSRLGKKVQLIGKVGDDEAGRRVLDYADDNGIDPGSIRVDPGLATGINIVLVDDSGQRHFLTDPKSSLRSLEFEDIMPYLKNAGKVVSFASLFVSPPLTIEKTSRLFREIKKTGRILLCDMTKAKNAETLDDIRCLLPYIDVILPNEEEIALLTGETDPQRNAALLLEAGAGAAVIKCGARGCVAAEGDKIYRVPAVSGIRCVDSTGAGDAFAAGFAAGLTEGLDLRACAVLGNAAASCAVEAIGAAEGTKDPEKIRQRYETNRSV